MADPGTLFLNFRNGTGRALMQEPRIWRRRAEEPGKVALEPVTLESFRAEIDHRKLAVVTHGFNVSHDSGVRGLGRLREAMGLDEGWRFVGVLWPGDAVIPFVNYPLEARDAAKCGRRLAKFLNAHAGHAAGFAFASHSLGARVVLDAAQALDHRVEAVCVTAAAADDDALTKQYPRLLEKVGRISVVASTEDLVLKLAYPAGDLISDITYDSDSPFRRALGSKGTRRPAPARTTNYQTPRQPAYDHGSYFPPGDGAPPAAQARQVIDHIARWFTAGSPAWPSASP